MGAINTTNLATNLGAYCSENNDKLFSVPLIGMSTLFKADGVTIWDNIVDETPVVSATTGHVLQPFNDRAFAPTDDAVKFDSRNLKLQSYKADLQIYPEDYRMSWLAHNNHGRAQFKDWTDIPLHEYIFNQVTAQINEDLRIATWKGVKTGTPTANVYLDWIDGFVKRISVGKAAGTIPTVTLGAITQANALDKIESLADAVSKEYAQLEGFIHVPRQVYNFFAKASFAAYGRELMKADAVPGKEGSTYESITIRNTNIKLVMNHELTFGATSQVFFTTKNNLYVGTNSMTQNDTVRFEAFERSIKMMWGGLWATQYAMDSKNTSATPLICSEAF